MEGDNNAQLGSATDSTCRIPHDEGSYPAPDRACYVCGQRAWQWNGEHYECGSGDTAHEERATWAWVHVSPPDTKEG